MTKHNASNERIKHQYFGFLKEAKRQSESTVDAAAKALDRFEEYTGLARLQGISLSTGDRLQEAACRAEGSKIWGEAQQGDSTCDADPTQAIL